MKGKGRGKNVKGLQAKERKGKDGTVKGKAIERKAKYG